MTYIKIDDLRELSLWRDLDTHVLEKIVEKMHCQQISAGRSVFTQNDENDDVFFVLSGHLRLTTYTVTGREVIFNDLHPGDLVGETSALDGEPRGANLIAVTNAEVASVDSRAFRALLREHPDFALAIMQHLSRLVRALNSRIHLLTSPVPTRICAELLRLAELRLINDNAARIVPAPKHVDVANRVNTQREAVSRTLSNLQRQKIVRRGLGELVVLDVAALRRLAEQDIAH